MGDGWCSAMEMKERQRWRPEEDAILRSYVRPYGPREWNLVAQRMNTPLDRNAKSFLERWKNYLRPGIKKGSLTDDEQRLAIRLQAKHGNKWKKIAAEVLADVAAAEWWEVFKEAAGRSRTAEAATSPARREGKVQWLLKNFEKLVKERQQVGRGCRPPHGSSMLPQMLSTPPTPVSNLAVARPSHPRLARLQPGARGSGSRWRRTAPKFAMPSAAGMVADAPRAILAELAKSCEEVEEGTAHWLRRKGIVERLKRGAAGESGLASPSLYFAGEDRRGGLCASCSWGSTSSAMSGRAWKAWERGRVGGRLGGERWRWRRVTWR
ncbi:hypothetical protein ZWY2020_054584 [Hordeum vulgare]|nr:hypothetical protein ZWY2020_054584 [Hordeum vulgare]